MRDRLDATGPGSEKKKFVNLASGSLSSVALRRLMSEMRQAGFGEEGEGNYHLVPAPLLVATSRGGRSVSLMPMGAPTIYGKIGPTCGRLPRRWPMQEGTLTSTSQSQSWRQPCGALTRFGDCQTESSVTTA